LAGLAGAAGTAPHDGDDGADSDDAAANGDCGCNGDDGEASGVWVGREGAEEVRAAWPRNERREPGEDSVICCGSCGDAPLLTRVLLRAPH
jgi:hypothetical protein